MSRPTLGTASVVREFVERIASAQRITHKRKTPHTKARVKCYIKFVTYQGTTLILLTEGLLAV